MAEARDEALLLQKSKEGDTKAFEELISVYQKKILNMAYRMLGDKDDAEDAAQDVFIRVYKSLASFHAEAAFSTWLYKIATNVCLDILRRKKRQNTKGTVSIHQFSQEDEEYEMPIADSAPTPYEEAQKSEARRALEEALLKLGPEQRAVIVLRDINGLSYEEIAEAQGCTLGTIKSRINRSRLMLRKLLEKDKELFLS